MKKKVRLGFLGYGNMAQAIAESFANEFNAWKIKKFGYKLSVGLYDIDLKKAEESLFGAVKFISAAEMIENSDVIFIAVKPQSAAEALKGLDFSGKIVISMMASVEISTIKKLVGGSTQKIVRMMPNLNARELNSYTVYTAEGISVDEKKLVRVLLESFGTAREIDEKDMNISTGICGSSPAFVFKFIRALIDAGVEGGLSKELAKNMAIETVIGSAYLVEELKDRTITELINSVCSKGGTTIEGVKTLEAASFEKTVIAAVMAAKNRAEELSVEFRDNK